MRTELVADAFTAAAVLPGSLADVVLLPTRKRLPLRGFGAALQKPRCHPTIGDVPSSAGNALAAMKSTISGVGSRVPPHEIHRSFQNLVSALVFLLDSSLSKPPNSAVVVPRRHPIDDAGLTHPGAHRPRAGQLDIAGPACAILA